MLADRRVLSHPTHGPIDTPLLVPAFSSKGFKLPHSTELGHDYSEVGFIVDQFPTYEAGSVLVSGYDLHYEHFEMPHDEISDDVVGKLGTAGIIIVDSGGYELSRDFDTSQIKTYQYQPKTDNYTEQDYRAVLSRLVEGKPPAPLVVTNFDHSFKNEPLNKQIEGARDLFDDYDGVASTFILKPWGEHDTVLHLEDLSSSQIADLRSFDAVGVTEKELGRSLEDRLRAISWLRSRFEEEGIDIPIHVWGGLDPVLTPLYFFAGADIFDGLSWLRYGFVDGMAVNREAAQTLVQSLNVRSNRQHTEYYLSMANCQILERLEIALAQWVDYGGGSFEVFEDNVAERLETAYEEMRAQIPQLRGAH